MTFKEAIEKTPHLNRAWKTGLQALRPEDKPHIAAADTRKITGSVDVDTAYKKVDPYGNRWDFGIAYQHTNRQAEVVYWVEPHTASDSQVSVVIKKAQWLLHWLKNDGVLLKSFEYNIVWVSSGATAFTDSSTQKKRMAQAGLQYVGNKLCIPRER